MDLIKQIQELEEEQQKLAMKKLNLEEKQKLREAIESKIDQLLSEIPSASPEEIAETIIARYGLKLNSRKPKGQRRKRTTITAELRDTVKAHVNSGQSMNSVSKQMELSYAVVVKIMKGSYDYLKSRAAA